MLAGVLPPDRGQVRLDGEPAATFDRRARARRVGLLPQSPRGPPDLTVRELVARGRYPHNGPFGRIDADDREAIRSAIACADLDDLVDRSLGTLSGGERRRAWIGLALAQRPAVVLLDEPTAHLDLRYATHALDVIRDLRDVHGLTVGVVLHDLNQAADLADRIVVLDDGCIAASGPPRDVLRSDLIADVFGAEVLVEQHPDEDTPLVLTRRNGSADGQDRPPRSPPVRTDTPT